MPQYIIPLTAYCLWRRHQKLQF